MAYVITDACISCGACEADCPVGAISQGDDHVTILKSALSAARARAPAPLALPRQNNKTSLKGGLCKRTARLFFFLGQAVCTSAARFL